MWYRLGSVMACSSVSLLRCVPQTEKTMTHFFYLVSIIFLILKLLTPTESGVRRETGKSGIMTDLEVSEPLFLPKGVAEPSVKVGYVTNANNGIDAINLDNGDLLWSTDAAAYPLFASSDWLMAQRALAESENVLQIAKLDTTRNGKLIFLADPIVFPEWVSLQTDSHEDFSFKVHANAHALYLDWHARARYRGGAYPPSYIVQQTSKDAYGTVRIDLRTGQVAMLPPADRTMTAEKESQAELLGGGWWIARGKLAALVWEESEGQQVLYLKTRRLANDQAIDQTVELAKGEALASYVTPDGRHVLVHSEKPEQSGPELRQPWWIFSAESGNLLAKLVYEPGTRLASILNSCLYYLVETQVVVSAQSPPNLQSRLKARDLTSGKLLWERILQEKPPSKPPPLRQ
jgi:hypothetical protein